SGPLTTDWNRWIEARASPEDRTRSGMQETSAVADDQRNASITRHISGQGALVAACSVALADRQDHSRTGRQPIPRAGAHLGGAAGNNVRAPGVACLDFQTGLVQCNPG